jgi:hypothetical protein
MAVLQAVPWTLVPLLFYSAPPGQLPLVLAIGHEFQAGTEYGPPLAFWLAEIAFRAGGMFGVYLLSQLCIVATYWAVVALGRAIVGETHAVMAVLLMAGIAVFSVPTPEFGPAILATPLWALVLLHYWRAAEGGGLRYWLAVGLEAGLLLLTTYAGLILVALVVLYMVASTFGRAQLETVGPWLAGLVAIVVLFPFLIWLDQGGGVRLLDLAAIVRNLRAWGWLVAALLIGHIGMGILVVLGRGYVVASRGPPPEVPRPPVDDAARVYVYFFALVPVAAMGLFALFSHRPENFMVAPLVVMSGLAVIVAAGDRIAISHQYLIGYAWLALLALPPLLVAFAILMQGWTVALDLRVGRPAADMGQFFGESFQRRTGLPLEIVAGDQALAALVALRAPSRPSLYLESPPEYRPRVTRQQIEDKGAVVVWAATDSAGRPPPEILARFPNLVNEVPQAFARRYQGRMPLTRIGWGVIRPHSQAGVSEPVPAPQPQSVPQPLPLPLPEPPAGPSPPPPVQARPQAVPQQPAPPPPRVQPAPPHQQHQPRPSQPRYQPAPPL